MFGNRILLNSDYQELWVELNMQSYRKLNLMMLRIRMLHIYQVIHQVKATVDENGVVTALKGEVVVN